jgi:undecaprenyl-diphosphatase
MTLTETVVRAALQAVAVVLPISESAHRALGDLWLGPADRAALGGLAAHLGSLLALALLVRGRLGAACAAAGRALRRPTLLAANDAGRDARAVLIAATVSLGLELGLAGPVARLEQQPLCVGAGLFATAAILALTPLAPSPRALTPGPLGAVAVGLAHGLGTVPGASQVGAAFVVLSWLGVRGWRAVELAFLVTVPTLGVAVAREIGHALATELRPSPATVAALAASTLVGLLGASAWKRIADGNRGLVFLGWIVPLGLAMLGYARATAL